MPRIDIGEGTLHYERHGKGFPLLFVSGLGGMAVYWTPQIAAFADRFDVIAYDHRGIGGSDRTPPPYSVDGMAADVVGLLDALDIRRAHVVGHSTGGAIAQILALEHPDRLAAIVIAGSWTTADAYFRRVFAMRKEALLRLGPEAYVAGSALFLYPPYWIAEHDAEIRRIEAGALAGFSDPAIVAARIDAICAFDRRTDLGRIQTPTLVVGAEDDAITPAYYSRELARRIPGADLVMLERGGHCFNQTEPERFNDVVAAFLAGHTPRAA
jgi:aminoacrylate hydrolase